MASKRAVGARTRTDNVYDAREGPIREGISASRMALDPARPGVEDLLELDRLRRPLSLHLRRRPNPRRVPPARRLGVQSAAGFASRPLPSGW